MLPTGYISSMGHATVTCDRMKIEWRMTTLLNGIHVMPKTQGKAELRVYVDDGLDPVPKSSYLPTC